MKYVIFFLLSFTLLGLEQQVGIIKSVEGKVYRVRSTGRDEALNKGDSIYSSDLITTKKGKIKIKFNDETEMFLARKTKLSIKKYVVDANKSKRFAILKLMSGDMKVNVKRKFGNNLFEISSGYITLEIKGTSFVLTNHSNKVSVFLTEGIISVKSALDKFNKLKLTPNKVLEVNGENLPVIKGMNMSQINSLNSKFKTTENKKSNKENKFKSFNEGEVTSSANKYISQMRAILSNAYTVLKKARKEKNIPKLDCVNSNVMTIKGYVRRAEDNGVAVDEAIAKSDINKARQLLAKIYSSFNEVKQAEISMKSCNSDIVEYKGNDNISSTVEELIVENDYVEEKYDPMDISFKKTDSSNTTSVELEPVQASPYF